MTICKSAYLLRALTLTAGAALIAGNGIAGSIVSGSLQAGLTTGSLAGVTFSVMYSYDASQINPSGDSYITLSSFDFNLLGTEFMRSDINQGGQVVFRNGILNNVTASFQGVLPPGSPVNDISFGFGGPGVIGYVDRAGAFGDGSFRFSAAPEPRTLTICVVALSCLLLRIRSA